MPIVNSDSAIKMLKGIFGITQDRIRDMKIHAQYNHACYAEIECLCIKAADVDIVDTTSDDDHTETRRYEITVREITDETSPI